MLQVETRCYQRVFAVSGKKTFAGYEVDFHLPESRQLIRIVQSMDHPTTREREARSLVDAMHTLNLPWGLILTGANAEPFAEDGCAITIHALVKWLLEK